MALTRKQQKKLGAIRKESIRKQNIRKFDLGIRSRSDLLAENLRLAEIIRDKSLKPRFKKMASEEIKLNKRDLAKLLPQHLSKTTKLKRKGK